MSGIIELELPPLPADFVVPDYMPDEEKLVVAAIGKRRFRQQWLGVGEAPMPCAAPCEILVPIGIVEPGKVERLEIVLPIRIMQTIRSISGRYLPFYVDAGDKINLQLKMVP